MPVPAKPRVCIRCKRLLGASHFYRYKSSNNRAASCITCRRERPHRPHGNRGAQEAPNPCTVCGKRFAMDLPPSRLATRKTCSKPCELASRRQQEKRCKRCRKVLPYDAYPPRSTTARGRHEACKRCVAKSKQGVTGFARRPSPHQLFRSIRARAEQKGVPHNFSSAAARRVLDGQCHLCGGPPSTVIRKSFSGGYTTDNVRHVCSLCRRLTRLITFEDLLLHAHAIALHAPLDLTKERPNA